MPPHGVRWTFTRICHAPEVFIGKAPRVPLSCDLPQALDNGAKGISGSAFRVKSLLDLTEKKSPATLTRLD